MECRTSFSSELDPGGVLGVHPLFSFQNCVYIITCMYYTLFDFDSLWCHSKSRATPITTPICMGVWEWLWVWPRTPLITPVCQYELSHVKAIGKCTASITMYLLSRYSFPFTTITVPRVPLLITFTAQSTSLRGDTLSSAALQISRPAANSWVFIAIKQKAIQVINALPAG